MEYFLCRAMEVVRLSPENLYSLQTRELISGRCRMPFEIEQTFHLPGLRETWRIPEAANLQDHHNMALRVQFRKLNLFPKYKDISPMNVEEVHKFDEAVRACRDLDLVCRMGTTKRNTKDDLE